MSVLLSIPSPSRGVWEVLGFPLRAYALCIIAGIVVGMIMSTRRWQARGGSADTLESVVVVAIPFGIVGARLYHVITDYELYFGPGRNPVDALKIWNGGLGVWGAVALGALGAYLVARHRHVRFLALLDTMAPGLVVAQGIGRLGNWFNSELFGRPTTLPWALQIAPSYRPSGFEQYATFHPTFLYELLWDFGVAAVLLWADRRFRLGHGKVFALYAVLYTAGRFWIEALRIDRVNEVAGFRLNNYTSAIVFLVALGWLLWLVRHRPGREFPVEGDGVEGDGVAGDGVERDEVEDDRTQGDGVEDAGATTDQTQVTAGGVDQPEADSSAEVNGTDPGEPTTVIGESAAGAHVISATAVDDPPVGRAENAGDEKSTASDRSPIWPPSKRQTPPS